MSIRDLELLEAKGGDQGKYNLAYERLRLHASSVALALFSNCDSVIRDEIVEKAMVKVSEWLITDMVLHLDHPWAYAKKIIHNSLFDSARAKRGKTETISFTETLSVGVTVRQEMAYIDEGFAKLHEEDTGNDGGSSFQDLGWRVFQVINTEPARQDDDERYYEHEWIQAIKRLMKAQWLWNSEHGDILWAKFNLITALIDNITSLSERHVVLCFLWGFKPVDISIQRNVTKAYVSKVLTGKWLKIWGWEDSDVYQARLVLLMHNLADIYKEIQDEVRESYSNAPLEAFHFEYGTTGRYYEGYHKERQNEIKAINNMVDKSKREKLEKNISDPQKRLYGKITTCLQTKEYFNDLDIFHIESFSELCYVLTCRCYPHIKPIRIHDKNRSPWNLELDFIRYDHELRRNYGYWEYRGINRLG